MTGDHTDPRPARSRARLLDAATALLRAGGPSAVTVEAVTRGANVARATLYRHFSSGNDLLAAAFRSLIPPAPMPPEDGALEDRLLALVLAQAELIADAPMTLTAMYWLALGSDKDQSGDAHPGAATEGAEVRTLRERIVEQYAKPFDAIFDSPQGRSELGEVDRTMAIALLIGPMVVGRISTVSGFDYRECARAAVGGFLEFHRRGGPAAAEITAPSTESAGV